MSNHTNSMITAGRPGQLRTVPTNAPLNYEVTA